MNRRDLLLGSTLLAIGNGATHPVHASAAGATEVFEVGLTGFDRALLPREHGQLTARLEPIRRRYPSREHCMQMAAFFGAAGGLLVYVNDPTTPPSDWTIRLNDRLRIEFQHRRPEVVVRKIEPTLAVAAASYREWAASQPWVTRRERCPKDLSLISVASNPQLDGQRRHLADLFSLVPKPVGAWFTQWRRFPFDELYPDYRPRDPASFARLLADMRQLECMTFPYVNALLWDDRLEEFAGTARDVALRDQAGKTVPYNVKRSYLRYACPHSIAWQEVIADARKAIRDDRGIESEGIYLDMLIAMPPMPCWSRDHGHEPGDRSAWVSGVRQLLAKVPGVVMSEGCAEPYLDHVDYALMHLYTQDPESVPLWSLVYGDIINAVGWRLPGPVTAARFSAELAEARRFGIHGLASPWMTELPESALLTPEVRRAIRDQVGMLPGERVPKACEQQGPAVVSAESRR